MRWRSYTTSAHLYHDHLLLHRACTLAVGSQKVYRHYPFLFPRHFRQVKGEWEGTNTGCRIAGEKGGGALCLRQMSQISWGFACICSKMECKLNVTVLTGLLPPPAQQLGCKILLSMSFISPVSCATSNGTTTCAVLSNVYVPSL